jgi:hypothetical protein
MANIRVKEQTIGINDQTYWKNKMLTKGTKRILIK